MPAVAPHNNIHPLFPPFAQRFLLLLPDEAALSQVAVCVAAGTPVHVRCQRSGKSKTPPKKITAGVEGTATPGEANFATSGPRRRPRGDRQTVSRLEIGRKSHGRNEHKLVVQKHAKVSTFLFPLFFFHKHKAGGWAR